MSEQIKHTPGPWRWEVNLKSRQIQLCGGKPRFDLTVMDFVRWGMWSAQPRLLRPMANSTMMLLEHATRYAVVVEGREHHSDWFQGIDHPDAKIIEAAPDLYQALAELRINANRLCDRNLGGTYEEDCRRSLAKAEAALTKARGQS